MNDKKIKRMPAPNKKCISNKQLLAIKPGDIVECLIDMDRCHPLYLMVETVDDEFGIGCKYYTFELGAGTDMILIGDEDDNWWEDPEEVLVIAITRVLNTRQRNFVLDNDMLYDL